MTTELYDKIHNLGWIVSVEDKECQYIENWSPLGEDIIIDINEEDDHDIITVIKHESENFDEDDHVEPLVEYRGTRGVPSSICDLVDDARAIHKMLDELYDAIKEN